MKKAHNNVSIFVLNVCDNVLRMVVFYLGTVQKLQVGVFSSGPLLRVGGWVQVALLKKKKELKYV